MFLSLASVQATPGPTNDHAAVEYVSAVKCATSFAEQATFQRRNIFAISEDAVKQCAAEIDTSANSLAQLVHPNATDRQKISNEYVAAKARVAAWNVIVGRLEAEESVAVPAGLDPILGEPQVRYIECSRSAGGIKFASVFFGEDWLTNILKKNEDERVQVFIEVGRKTCPNAYQKLIDAARAAGEGKERSRKQQLQDDIAGAELFAARTWVRQVEK